MASEEQKKADESVLRLVEEQKVNLMKCSYSNVADDSAMSTHLPMNGSYWVICSSYMVKRAKI